MNRLKFPGEQDVPKRSKRTLCSLGGCKEEAETCYLKLKCVQRQRSKNMLCGGRKSFSFKKSLVFGLCTCLFFVRYLYNSSSLPLVSSLNNTRHFRHQNYLAVIYFQEGTGFDDKGTKSTGGRLDSSEFLS